MSAGEPYTPQYAGLIQCQNCGAETYSYVWSFALNKTFCGDGCQAQYIKRFPVNPPETWCGTTVYNPYTLTPIGTLPQTIDGKTEAEFFADMENFAPQSPKDAPRSFYLSKEDIDLIESACVGYTDEFAGYDSEKATVKQIKTLLNKLGCKPREWL